MKTKIKSKSIRTISPIPDQLANERTFLAWIRTSIGIMAFGFVVEKFALFLKQIAVVLGANHLPVTNQTLPAHIKGFSLILGTSLVGFGTLLSLLAFIKYKIVQNQIEAKGYSPNNTLEFLLALIIFLMGLLLTVYLL